MSKPSRPNSNQTRHRIGIELVPGRTEIPVGPPPQGENRIPSVPALQPDIDWRVALAKDFIDRQSGQVGTGLDHLCQQLDMGISASHLSRLFRQEIGLGVREYSKRMRMRAAVHKLTNTALPIKHISADLGYCSPADFFRQFKHQFKITPCKFRILERRRRNYEPRTA